MLHDVQNHARSRALRAGQHARSGPFVLRFDPRWASPYVNYAIPDDGAAPTAAEVDALVQAFRERDRRPRLEYLPGCAPQAEPALLAAGLLAAARVQHTGYGEPGDPDIQRIYAGTGYRVVGEKLNISLPE